jgi:phosphoenolpyruvate carboxykinase (ATP)
MGVDEPQATFSACFGAAFLVWPPSVYAEMLAEKIREHGAEAWLVNTGLTGGPYGTGHRVPLEYTRAMIDAIHDGSLLEAPKETEPVFGLAVPTRCPGVPTDILRPRETWDDPAAYDEKARTLVGLFDDHFARYEDMATPAVAEAGPQLAGA